MDFEFKGVKYFVHRNYKKWFGFANYVYFKNGELLFIDYENEELRKTITIFKMFLNR
jgi:hypothetical protein